MPDATLPDPREQLREFLLSRAAVTAIAGNRISVALSGAEPSIRLAFVAGSVVAPGAGTPLIQVECWGTRGVDDGKASDLARAVMAQLIDFHGVYAGGQVGGASEEGWFDAWDQGSGRPREIVQVRMLSHAALA